MKQKKAQTQNQIDLIHTYEKEYTNVFLFIISKTFLSQINEQRTPVDP
jgi:hypothetical protein